MPDRLQEIRARLDRAMAGVSSWSNDHGTLSPDVVTDGGFLVASVDDGADRDLIAHAPADIAWCLGEIERLRNTTLSVGNPLCDEPVVHEATKLECSDARAVRFADCFPSDCTCGLCHAEAEAIRAIVAERDAAAERVAILRAEVSDLEAELSRVTQ